MVEELRELFQGLYWVADISGEVVAFNCVFETALASWGYLADVGPTKAQRNTLVPMQQPDGMMREAPKRVPDEVSSPPRKRFCARDETSPKLLSSLHDEFKCPISMELMVDAVVASDGRLYERTEIERWLSCKGTSPLTQAPMHAASVVACHPVRNAIEALVSNGSVAPSDEALYQLRRGKLAHAKGDEATARASFARAADLGNSDAKFLYALSLLEDAAPSSPEAAALLSRTKPLGTVSSLAGHFATSFCDELIEVRTDGTVLFNGELHPDNRIHERPNGLFQFNHWLLDLDASNHARLLWTRPKLGDPHEPHRIWWFAYDPLAPPNCKAIDFTNPPSNSATPDARD